MFLGKLKLHMWLTLLVKCDPMALKNHFDLL